MLAQLGDRLWGAPRSSPGILAMLDVLVIGGGNAALCAALMAREAGASVMILESAPKEWRGGNSQHTRNLRCMHDAPQDEIGRASCRERVSVRVDLGGRRIFKKKKKKKNENTN